MKPLNTFMLVTLDVLLGSVSASADLHNGLTAWKSGDYASALRESIPLAEQGDADAKFNSRGMYDNGWGVPENDKTAVKWYTLAAEQVNARAQFNLGLMYEHGQGVPTDYKTSTKRYRLATVQRDACTQINLGVMYRLGRGVTQNYVYAHIW